MTNPQVVEADLKRPQEPIGSNAVGSCGLYILFLYLECSPKMLSVFLLQLFNEIELKIFVDFSKIMENISIFSELDQYCAIIRSISG